MNFTTPVSITKSVHCVDFSSEIITIGSCFAVNMGERLDYCKFKNTTNPSWSAGTKSYITEIALLDSDKDVLVISKLQSPVQRQGIQQFVVKLDF